MASTTAWRAASTVPPSPMGGGTYWATGSAMAKNMMPVPMPAAKSMAAQEKVEKSGVELSGPSLTSPYLVTATRTTKTSAAVMRMM